MWSTNLLPGTSGVCPTCPTCENEVGQDEAIAAVTLSDLSDLSDQKKVEKVLSGENHQKEEGIAQNSSDDPRSVRLLPLGDEADTPTAAQLAHARRMLVTCPSTGGKLHCWYCSRCGEARTCTTWRSRRADVEFFRQSEKPYSLYLVEEAAKVLQ